MPRRSLRLLALVLALALPAVLVAPAAGAARAPDGYDTATVKSAGLRIAVPDGWLEINPKSSSAEDALQTAVAKNPQLSGLMDQFRQIRGSIRFWALDTNAASFATNLLVLPTPYSKSTLSNPAAMKSTLASELGGVARDLTVVRVKVDRKAALEATATLPLTTVDGKDVTAYATIYLVPTKKGVVDLDYTSITPRDTDETLATMVKSIDIT